MDKAIESRLPKIKETFQRYGAYNVYLFGSCALGSMRKDSDVDFIFSFPKDLHYEVYTRNYFSLLCDLESITGRQVDLVAEYTLSNPYLIQKINSQKIKLL